MPTDCGRPSTASCRARGDAADGEARRLLDGGRRRACVGRRAPPGLARTASAAASRASPPPRPLEQPMRARSAAARPGRRPLAVQDQGGHRRAVAMRWRAQRRAAERHQRVAVEPQPAGRHLVDDSAGPGARRTRMPFCATTVWGTWQLSASAHARSYGGLAMHRHGDRGLHPVIHAPARRAPDGRRHGRNVASRSMITSTPAPDQGVLQPPIGMLVAGDDARGEDRGVARPRAPTSRMLAAGDAWPAPRAARPGCRCRSTAPCRAADSPHRCSAMKSGKSSR